MKMPKRSTSVDGRKKRRLAAQKKKLARSQESMEKREERLEKVRKRLRESTSREASQDTTARLSSDRERKRLARSSETPDQTRRRLDMVKEKVSLARSSETPDQTRRRLDMVKEKVSLARSSETHDQTRRRLDADCRRRANKRQDQEHCVRIWSAIDYDPNFDYKSNENVSLGSMSIECQYCHALKFLGETPSLCCSKGKVRLPVIDEPPQPLLDLLTGYHPQSLQFLKYIRCYNNAFAMTSFGATILTEPGFTPSFKIQGQIHHRIGSLFSPDGTEASFLQVYFTGGQEASLRCGTFAALDHGIVEGLQQMLHSNNSLIKSFKAAIEKLPDHGPDCKLIIDAEKRPTHEHARRFNLPETNEVGILLKDEQHGKRDIVLHARDSSLKSICETHRSYDSLQYPLILFTGQDGYHFGIKQFNSNKCVTCMQFYSFLFMTRKNSFNMLMMCRDLYQQFAVDMFAKVQSERLLYIKLNQKKLRADSYVHLKDQIREDKNVEDIGKVCILPSTFTGSPRYMHEKTQDAMTYVRKFGKPDLFITFTANPNWFEVKNQLTRGQQPRDRQDIIARIFRLKLSGLMKVITKYNAFGPVQCHMYTIEWQKRGLPHAHILIWLSCKIKSQEIDKIICAEFPNPDSDPELFQIIKKQMVHGPCGKLNPRSPCMINGICSKNFPKKFTAKTTFSADGYPAYRRQNPQDGGLTTIVRRHKVDNRWIVPYSPLLCKTFQSHINVEYCNSVKCIQYICKYINKGADAAMFAVKNEADEVEKFQVARYIGSNEAFWRIFGFPIHERYPPIEHLAVHLENGQRVTFTDQTAASVAENPPATTLTAFFDLCSNDYFAKTLFYYEVPSYYTWSNKEWKRRKRGKEVEGYPEIKMESTIGRVYSVHPNHKECFYLRILLHEVKGPTSFDFLKTVDGVSCSTYHDACLKLGLLANDSQWSSTIEEAAISRSPKALRCLFAMLLFYCEVSDPLTLWNNFKNELSQDFLFTDQFSCDDNNLTFSDTHYNSALIDIENCLYTFGCQTLSAYNLPLASRSSTENNPSLISLETSYDARILQNFVAENVNKLLPDQRVVFNNVLDSVFKDNGGIFFLDAPGGTGKTFVLKLLLAEVRRKNVVALAVASSGIAATLLPGGRTAHSTFKLPLNLFAEQENVCNINKTSQLAQLLRMCKLIVWDEVTMSHKLALETVNKTLKDLRNSTLLMGGITVLLSGDFRQTLPIIPRGTKADELQACIKSSVLWNYVNIYSLSTNMRSLLSGDSGQLMFANNLLKLGNGNLDQDAEGRINREEISTPVTSLEMLQDQVFPNLTNNYLSPNWLCERAILAPKNDTVNLINTRLLELIPGREWSYRSFDSTVNDDDGVDFPIEFLNSLEPAGLPPHKLILKVGCPVMLLRNMSQPKLCNGTRLVIKSLQPNVIEVTIKSGSGYGDHVFIPRIPLIPSTLPFKFRRLQFPLRLCFAMTINKSHDQTLKVAGLDLSEDCFSHGQLYVGASRVGSKANLYTYSPSAKIKNVVYKEVFTLGNE